MTAVLSEKVTIPKKVRDKLGLLPGAVLEFSAANGKLIGEKKIAVDVFSKWRGRGRLPKSLSVTKYFEQARDADRRR